ncbi:hypothetical protein MtrunA17_Chr4g0002611 [Medicago truncatula]|uniref:Uncharacterized protein n=1 Tax=Medicago truncatula TaxID=3880 RepID=A0A396I138_MEDTR|nr:hypothetical protein MtrunA17_Chr4g0002611 [Medicago truncatula]
MYCILFCLHSHSLSFSEETEFKYRLIKFYLHSDQTLNYSLILFIREV